jgi:uncharacterized metal-binding protein YceD (DUF177 family)
MNAAPISLNYNLGRLGQAGDVVNFEAGADERAALAKFAGLLDVPELRAKITLKKLAPTRFEIAYDFTAQVIQSCVVTLEPVPARIQKSFTRELHHTPNLRRVSKEEVLVAPGDDEEPEEIESLQFDLAAPFLEEFLLALDPYPRAPGVEFTPPAGAGEAPESPFAVLKNLKSRD